MSMVKQSIVSLAWAGLVVTGLGIFASDAEAFASTPHGAAYSTVTAAAVHPPGF